MKTYTFEAEELLSIVAQLAERYAGYESTSVSYEKAEQLMEAVVYTMHEFEKSSNFGITAESLTAREVYTQGRRILQEKIQQTRECYNRLILQFDSYGNRCLDDTIRKGIPEFFKWYDPVYAPQNTILTLDYPILANMEDLTGIDAISRYLQSIQLEQKFLGKQNRTYVMQVLDHYHPCQEQLIENLCGIVLPNLIGHFLLKKPLTELFFKPEDWKQLKEQSKTIQDFFPLLQKMTETIICEFYNNDREMFQYLLPELSNLAVRIKHAMEYDCLEQIFTA